MNEIVLTREQSRFVDSLAEEKYGIPGIVLMENAGLRCADIVLSLLEPFDEPRSVVVLTGKGNNGGDGYVVARHLYNRGVAVRIIGVDLKGERSLPAPEPSAIAELGRRKREARMEKMGIEPPRPNPNDAAVNLRIVRNMGIPMLEVGTELPVEAVVSLLEDTDIVVDAMLGTGTRGAPREPYAGMIEAANSSGKLIVAVDIPSGLDANTGEAAGVCIRADHTVTFGAKKAGFLRGDGPRMCGTVHVADISIPRALLESIAGGGEG